MSTDRIRAALQALTELEGHTLVDCTADWAEAMIEARAALAAEPVVEGPTDEEVEVWADQQGFVRGHADLPFGFWIDYVDVGALVRAALSRWGHQPAPPADGEVGKDADVRRICEIILGNTFGNKELDSLALLVGHHPDVLNASPVSTEEVRELVAWLRDRAESTSLAHNALRITRAADLLEQRHPTPVPVSEHPWKRDRWCDDEGRCWCFNQWDLQWELEYYTAGAHWCDWMLPATALPLPQGEVER